MLLLVLRGLGGRKLRSALTALAIVLGVAMISGTYVLTDQINGAFSDIFDKAYQGTAVVVTPKAAFGASGGGGGGGDRAGALYVDQSLLDRAASVTGVAHAAGAITEAGFIVANGTLIKPSGGAPPLLNSHQPPPFTATTVVAGAYPAADQIAVDTTTAANHHLTVGERVELVTATGLTPVVISGTISFPTSVGGATLLLAQASDIQRWFSVPGRYSQLLLAAKPGVSQAQLAANVEQAIGSPNVEVKTAKQYAHDQSAQIANALSFLQYGLLIFGVVAAFVGGFIIFNTFSITVAQRLREFGMLRTLGASRRQVLNAVVGEALVVALIGSLVGIGVGVAIAVGVDAIFNAIGLTLPTRAATLSTTGTIVGLVIGIGVTLVAALVPAVRATRIAPIAAVREGATMPPGRLARFTPLLAAVFGLLGFLAIVQVFVTSGPVASRLAIMGLGALLFFVAVAMVARYTVGPIARVVGYPLEWIGGLTGRLARDNAMRNPNRTAVTSAALMIGLALVVFVSVFAAGLKQTIANTVNGSFRGDLVIQSSSFGRIPGATVAAVAGTPGVAEAAGVYTDQAKFNNAQQGIVGIDPVAFPKLFKTPWTHGSDTVFAQLGGDGVVIDKDLASSKHLVVGSTLRVESRAGAFRTLTVRGVYDSSNNAISGELVPLAVFSQLSTTRDVDLVLAATTPGQAPNTVEQAVKRSLASFPLADVQTRDQFTKSNQDQLNPILYLFYALLSLSVVISLFGIVNTLILSIFERTREIGMLRGIGLSRWQTRWMICFESVITAVIGAVLGLLVGLFFGFVVTTGLKSQGLTFAVPTTELVVFLLLAIIAGVLSSVFPARRAARLNVLQALQYE